MRFFRWWPAAERIVQAYCSRICVASATADTTNNTKKGQRHGGIPPRLPQARPSQRCQHKRLQ